MSGNEKEIPQYIVHSFQIHQEREDHDVIDIDYYERNFPIGSLFSFNLQSSNNAANSESILSPLDELSWDENINPCTINVGEGAHLMLKSAVLNPSDVLQTDKNASSLCGTWSLYVSTNVNPDYVCIAPNISKQQPVHDLSISVMGPAIIKFALVYNNCDQEEIEVSERFHIINIFGNVKLCPADKGKLISESYKSFLQLEADQNADVDFDSNEADADFHESKNNGRDAEMNSAMTVDDTEAKGTSSSESAPKKKKRKLSFERDTANEKENKTDLDESTATPSPSPEPKKLTKKQRKKLAKEKEKQLQSVIAKDNNHASPSKLKKSSDAADTPSIANKSLTRQRMIEGGILVQDIIHGTGSAIRNGRRVSINYVGTFPDTNKVFDKNQSKSAPLTFRVGTGEVIKGLDKGLLGMKVGGERVITIPPELGYGKKGNGDIPGNSTLCFTVQLKSMGGVKR